jgi:hypothetical protein
VARARAPRFSALKDDAQLRDGLDLHDGKATREPVAAQAGVFDGGLA